MTAAAASAPDGSVLLLCGAGGGPTDALQQYSSRLAAALVAGGVPSRVAAVPAPRLRVQGSPGIDDVVDGEDAVVVLQYNPFSFGHLGIAPWLVRDLARLRRDRPRLRLALMCHETVALTPGPRWTAVRQVHRAQLAALVRLADRTFVSTGRWIPSVQRLGAGMVRRLPVGSNLPDRRGERHATRRDLGVGDGLVLASFGTGHPSHRDDLLEQAITAAAGGDAPTTVLTLGAGRAPVVRPAAGIREIAPGFLPAGEVAALLAASDVFVGPYVDGVSTRRGTAMAALQHGVAVVATTGPSTDPDLVRLLGPHGVPVGDGGAAVARAVAFLAADGEARRAHGAAGREAYLAAYDWPAVAAGLLGGLEERQS